MKKILFTAIAFIFMALSSSVFTSCNEIYTMNKGWWYYTVQGKQLSEKTDITVIEKALTTAGMFAHGATYTDAEAQWKWFISQVDDSKVVIEGDDYCSVTLTWDSDYDNPGIDPQIIGNKVWGNITQEVRE